MLQIDFINVGYGDSILVRDTEASFSMLVDCGDVHVGQSRPDGLRISAADYLRREGVEALDLLVLTHQHLDHAVGLARLLPGIRVQELWTNYLPPEEAWGKQLSVPAGWSAGARCLMQSLNIYLEALDRLRTQGTQIRLIQKTQDSRQLTPQLNVGIYLEEARLQQRQAEIWSAALNGTAAGEDLDELDGFINNTSIRLRLSCEGADVELPGDVYAACWEKHSLSPCTVMKMPHHGHRDALTPRLLEMLRPRYAVISVSDSRTDDCPSADVFRMLSEFGVKVFYTDAIRDPNGHSELHESVRFQIICDYSSGGYSVDQSERNAFHETSFCFYNGTYHLRHSGSSD